MLQCSQAGRIHSEFGVLISQINHPDSNYTLSMANRLYGTKAMVFHQVRSYGMLGQGCLGILYLSHHKISKEQEEPRDIHL